MNSDNKMDSFQFDGGGLLHHRNDVNDAGKPIDYRFLEINPALEKLAGIPGEEALPGRNGAYQARRIGYYGNIKKKLDR